MIADCINDIINNNDNIDLCELEHYNLYLYNKEEMLIVIKNNIINKLNNDKYNEAVYLIYELKNALAINTPRNTLHQRGYFMAKFDAINCLNDIWDNKNLMNYLLNL